MIKVSEVDLTRRNQKDKKDTNNKTLNQKNTDNCDIIIIQNNSSEEMNSQSKESKELNKNIINDQKLLPNQKSVKNNENSSSDNENLSIIMLDDEDEIKVRKKNNFIKFEDQINLDDNSEKPNNTSKFLNKKRKKRNQDENENLNPNQTNGLNKKINGFLKENKLNADCSTCFNLLKQLVKIFSFEKITKEIEKKDLRQDILLDYILKKLIEEYGRTKIMLSLIRIEVNENDEKSKKENNYINLCENIDVNQENYKGKKLIDYSEYCLLGLHYHKDNKGNIYKYKYRSINPKSLTTFYCSDNTCNGTAVYFTETKKFEIRKEHSISHEEHCYLKNKYKGKDPIYNEFLTKSVKEAQIYRNKNGDKAVIWYN